MSVAQSEELSSESGSWVLESVTRTTKMQATRRKALNGTYFMNFYPRLPSVCLLKHYYRHITAEDVDPTLSTYGLPLQQDPVDAIDIIGWSKQIILGQIGTSNNATNITLTNKTWTNGTTPNIRRHSQHSQHANQLISPYRLGLQKRVDGPIQCGPGQPCLDESCCSKEGKCGYKAAQCAPENCISNCDAKAMCGIDSVGGKTKCGLKLCCSFYGWCGTEDVHCKDPEPLIGKT